jgi:hypothetical protein
MNDMLNSIIVAYLLFPPEIQTAIAVSLYAIAAYLAVVAPIRHIYHELHMQELLEQYKSRDLRYDG